MPDALRPDFHQAPDGARIATYQWSPTSGDARAVVQIAHGAAEHARRYDRFGRFLAEHGYAVLASDHRGHGATAPSTGGRGAVGQRDGWRATVEDLRRVGEGVRAAHPAVPLFLLGHSMGSMLARDYAQEYGEDLAGLILSGTFRTLPGAEIEGALAELQAVIAEQGRDAPSDFVPRLFSSFNDPYPYRTGFEWLSRDEAEVDRYVADEDCGFPFSAGLSADWLRAARKVNDPRQQARVPSSLPVHVVVGAEDPCHSGMTLVYELLEDFRYSGTRDLTWRSYPGARHEILNETHRAEVQRDLLAWLDEHV